MYCNNFIPIGNAWQYGNKYLTHCVKAVSRQDPFSILLLSGILNIKDLYGLRHCVIQCIPERTHALWRHIWHACMQLSSCNVRNQQIACSLQCVSQDHWMARFISLFHYVMNLSYSKIRLYFFPFSCWSNCQLLLIWDTFYPLKQNPYNNKALL